MNNIAMITQEAVGGHINYTHELLDSLARLNSEFLFELICCNDPNLTSEPMYKVSDILPRKRNRDEFRNKVAFAIDRHAYFLRREYRTLKYLEKSGCSIVHFQDVCPWLGPFLFRKLQRKGVKIAFTVHNIFPHNYFGFPKSFINQCYRGIWSIANVLFIHSENLRRDLLNIDPMLEQKTLIAPHGVWRRKSHVSRVRDHSLAPNVLLFGHLRRNKNIELAIEIAIKYPEMHLTIAGIPEDDSYKQSIQTKIDKCGLRNVSFIARYVSEKEVDDLFADADICILPYSDFSSQSGVLFMAASYGVPLVVTDCGALSSTVSTTDIGLIADLNPSSFAQSIKELWKSEVHSQKRKCLARFADQNSWNVAAESTLKGYRSA